MRGPGFVCCVGGFGPCCLPPSRSETCCRGRVCGTGLVLSDGSLWWGGCERAYGADPDISADLIRWSCCGRSYGAGCFLVAVLIWWSCCGRSYGAGPFLAVALRWSALWKVLTSTGRPGLWWSATGRRRWPHGAWLVSMMACYLDFLVRREYNDSDKKQKTKQKQQRWVKQGASKGLGHLLCDNSLLLKEHNTLRLQNQPCKTN